MCDYYSFLHLLPTSTPHTFIFVSYDDMLLFYIFLIYFIYFVPLPLLIPILKHHDPYYDLTYTPQTKVHALRAYREIRLLRFMNHENVIMLRDLFIVTPPDTGSLYDITNDVTVPNLLCSIYYGRPLKRYL